VDIIFKKQTIGAGTWIGSVSVDASIHELHGVASEATDHPVEEGCDSTDHVRPKPRYFRIDGMITNTPLRLPLSHADGVQEVEKEFKWEQNPELFGQEIGGAGAVGMALGALSSIAGLNQRSGMALGFEPAFDRVYDTFDELDKIVTEGRVVDIVTTLRVYHNMIIESLEVDREKSTGNALRFTAVAKQIRTVETEIVSVPEPLVERGKPTQNRGKKAGKGIDDAVSDAASDKASILVNALGM